MKEGREMQKYESLPRMTVKCPLCGRRIFDIKKGTKGSILIKCPSCRVISEVNVSFRMINRSRRIRRNYY